MRNIPSLLAALLLGACVGQIEDPQPADGTGDMGEGDLPAVDDTPSGVPTDSFYVGQRLRVCNATGLYQRSGPGTEYSVIRTMPEGTSVTVLELIGWWAKNDWSGRVGWSSREYLCTLPAGMNEEGSFDHTTPSRDAALSIGRAATGYTYWWGHGRLDGTKAGACYGTCGDCTHEGSYGADCSGFVGKAWMLDESMPFDSDKHPFSTWNFYNETTHWQEIDRTTTLPGDAMVRREDGAGHIFLYESNDPWGSMWAFEARGCSYGIVHNLRTAATTYKAIRRDGFE